MAAMSFDREGGGELITDTILMCESLCPSCAVDARQLFSPDRPLAGLRG